MPESVGSSVNDAMEYDAWLLWMVPYKCNLDCEYCTTPGLRRSSKVRDIDIPSVMGVLDKTGMTFKVTFSGGGDPLLAIPNIIDACESISKKHYISLITNLTCTDKVKEFVRGVDPGRVTQVIASAHTKMLEERGLLETYFENFLLFKDNGFNIISSEVAYPPLLKDAERLRKLFKKRGIELLFGPYTGSYKGKAYPKDYTKSEIDIFKIDPTTHFNHERVCNAGYNVAVVNPDGRVETCHHVEESIGHIYKKIKFKKKLIRCHVQQCACPLNIHDNYLFRKALKDKSGSYREFKGLTSRARLARNIDIEKYRMLEFLHMKLDKNFPRSHVMLRRLERWFGLA